jgi:hypothetical protein
MGRKQLAAFAALACVATPSVAFDSPAQQTQGMMVYVALPLDGRNVKEQAPAYGLSFQGRREFETVKVDSRMFNFFGTGLEAKWIVAGVVATGAAVAVASKDKKTSTAYQQQQQVQAQQKAEQQAAGGGTGGGTSPTPPCPVTPKCP